MMKTSYFFIFIFFASACAPLMGMEWQRPTTPYPLNPNKQVRKSKSIFKRIVKREAHKAEYEKNNRKEQQRILMQQNFQNMLYEKYAITRNQGFTDSQIRKLSDKNKQRLLAKLKKRNVQLFMKGDQLVPFVCDSITTKAYDDILNTFIIETYIDRAKIKHAEDEALKFAQHYRNINSALVWAATEFRNEVLATNKENYINLAEFKN